MVGLNIVVSGVGEQSRLKWNESESQWNTSRQPAIHNTWNVHDSSKDTEDDQAWDRVL